MTTLDDIQAGHAKALAIFAAIEKGDKPALDAALSSGPLIDAKSTARVGLNGSPMIWAVENKKASLIETLVLAGESPDARPKGHDNTPLTLAALSGDAPCVAALLKAGAKVGKRGAHGGDALMGAAGVRQPFDPSGIVNLNG